jgi:hypothetical protein
MRTESRILSSPIHMELHMRQSAILHSTTTIRFSRSRVPTGMSLEISSSVAIPRSEALSPRMGSSTLDHSLKMGTLSSMGI